MHSHFSISLLLQARASHTWDVLTQPPLMCQWLGEGSQQIEVSSSWKVNAPIVISGMQVAPFVTKGIVLEYVREQRLTYNLLHAISSLPDAPSSYTVIDFMLEPREEGTLLTLTVSNFADEVIRKHHAFYWRGTMRKIKQMAEMRNGE